MVKWFMCEFNQNFYKAKGTCGLGNIFRNSGITVIQQTELILVN